MDGRGRRKDSAGLATRPGRCGGACNRRLKELPICGVHQSARGRGDGPARGLGPVGKEAEWADGLLKGKRRGRRGGPRKLGRCKGEKVGRQKKEKEGEIGPALEISFRPKRRRRRKGPA